MAENLVKGLSYRVKSSGDTWDKCSFKTHASDVFFDENSDVDENLGDIKGITTDLYCENESIAASAKAVGNSFGGLSFGQNAEGKWGYKVGASTEIIPFKGDITLLPTIEFKHQNSNGYFWLFYDVTELTEVSYETTAPNAARLEYDLDDGSQIRFPATSGTIDVSAASKLRITCVGSTSTNTSFIITGLK